MSTCPKCGHDDMIRKVSSIVSQGRSTGYAAGLDGGYSVSSTTDLAKRLAAPTRPSMPGVLGCTGPLLVVGLVACVVLALLLQSINPGLLPSMLEKAATSKVPLLRPEYLFFLGLALIWILWWLSEKSKLRKALSLWEQATRRWNRIYYCYRDDIVFDEDGTSQSLDTMRPWLYR
jgi:hypothetical protein